MHACKKHVVSGNCKAYLAHSLSQYIIVFLFVGYKTLSHTHYSLHLTFDQHQFCTYFFSHLISMFLCECFFHWFSVSPFHITRRNNIHVNCRNRSELPMIPYQSSFKNIQIVVMLFLWRRFFCSCRLQWHFVFTSRCHVCCCCYRFQCAMSGCSANVCVCFLVRRRWCLWCRYIRVLRAPFATYWTRSMYMMASK